MPTNNIKDKYKPLTLKQKLGYFTEECGEALAAVGKSIRWGLESVNPELNPKQQEINGDWIARELIDLKRAIQMLEDALILEGYHVNK